MAETPLLAIRCPQDLIDAIERERDETGRSKTDVVVERLRQSIPSVPVLQRNSLPSVPAVYFVFTPDNRLLYIGRAKNLKSRWAQHHRFSEIVEIDRDSRIAWFEFPDANLDTLLEVEGELLAAIGGDLNGSASLGGIVGFRIPDELRERFEEYGRENFPKGDSFDITKTILDLIRKGLSLPSEGQTSVQQFVEQEVKRAIEALREEFTPVWEEQRALEKKIAGLEAGNDVLKQKAESMERILKIQEAADIRPANPSNARKSRGTTAAAPMEVGGSGEEGKLTLKEAHEIATARGYTGSRDLLSKALADGSRVIHGIRKVGNAPASRFARNYIDTGD